MADKYNIFGAGGTDARIMRTVYFTLCEGDELDERNGKTADFHDMLIGRYTPKRATRHLNRQGLKQVRITRTVVMKQLVSMPFWDFWQYAEASSDPSKVSEWVLDKQIF